MLLSQEWKAGVYTLHYMCCQEIIKLGREIKEKQRDESCSPSFQHHILDAETQPLLPSHHCHNSRSQGNLAWLIYRCQMRERERSWVVSRSQAKREIHENHSQAIKIFRKKAIYHLFTVHFSTARPQEIRMKQKVQVCWDEHNCQGETWKSIKDILQPVQN